ncbi:hypothetical protein IWW39_005041 [Coemansia spiralis]|uniref:Vacuolar ATPase assembly protein VMA22 n=1 Tax=Coemansia spiralis TaxID=417178 RepID=A0A9W8L2T5_9FUNG|nr:hypothetical protein IWW39_005041 [Coemansia spiralis]
MSESTPSPALIDSQLLELFGCVAEYQQLRDSSSSLLRQSFFNLAQAKRSAGYQWISPDLYSGRARAIATVSIDEEHPVSMRVVRNNSHTGSDDKQEQDSDKDNADSGLRRRGQRSSDEAEDEEDSPGDAEKPAKKQRAAAGNDPLLWFGMLVPPALKSAQSGFVSSLDQLVRLAQLKHRIAQQQLALQEIMSAAAP